MTMIRISTQRLVSLIISSTGLVSAPPEIISIIVTRILDAYPPAVIRSIQMQSPTSHLPKPIFTLSGRTVGRTDETAKKAGMDIP